MRVFGSGPPLVLVPGLQGRWEWMRPAVDALAAHFRVITFSLAGEPAARYPIDARLGFDTFVDQIDRALDEAGEASATICGVSYGGLIATRYAARRPERTRELVLVASMPPDYRPDGRARFYCAAPRLLFPIFCVDSWFRVSPELRAAFPSPADRWTFRAEQLGRVLGAPTTPRLMRQRMALIDGREFESDARRITAPALVLTGEPGLDRTVLVELTGSCRQYVPHAEWGVIERTGHLGVVTRPARFAELVHDFVTRARREHGASRRAAGF